MAAITKYHKLSGLKEQKFFIIVLKATTTLRSGCFAGPRLSKAVGRILPLPSPKVFFFFKLWQHIFNYSYTPVRFYILFKKKNKKTHIGLGPPLMTFLTWWHLQRPCFQIRPRSKVLGSWNFNISLWWTQFNTQQIVSSQICPREHYFKWQWRLYWCDFWDREMILDYLGGLRCNH